jgi:hypothetical protein
LIAAAGTIINVAATFAMAVSSPSSQVWLIRCKSGGLGGIYRMAMGREARSRQGDLIATWEEMPHSPGHVFYDRLQEVLRF